MQEIACPSCRNLVRIDRVASDRLANCSHCGQSFPIAFDTSLAVEKPQPLESAVTSTRPLNPLRYDDLSQTRWRWQTTLLGLRWQWWGTLFVFLATEIFSAVSMIFPLDAAELRGSEKLLALIVTSYGCFSILAYLAVFAGMCMCSTAPDRRSKRLAILTVANVVLCVLSLVALMVVVLVRTMQIAQNREAAPANIEQMVRSFGMPFVVAGGAAIVFSVTAMASWLLFYGHVARAFGNLRLRRFAWIVLAIWFVTTPINPLLSYGSSRWFHWDPVFESRVLNATGMIQGVVIWGSYLFLCARTIRTMKEGERALATLD